MIVPNEIVMKAKRPPRQCRRIETRVSSWKEREIESYGSLLIDRDLVFIYEEEGRLGQYLGRWRSISEHWN